MYIWNNIWNEKRWIRYVERKNEEDPVECILKQKQDEKKRLGRLKVRKTKSIENNLKILEAQ